jgi:hypothetical protein
MALGVPINERRKRNAEYDHPPRKRAKHGGTKSHGSYAITYSITPPKDDDLDFQVGENSYDGLNRKERKAKRKAERAQKKQEALDRAMFMSGLKDL